MTRRLISILAAVNLAALPLAAQAAEVWVASASEKVRPEAASRNVTTAKIAAARNEFEAFQVVVRGPAKGVRAVATDLKGPGTIGGVRLFRAALINVATLSAIDGKKGQTPDALVPDVDDVVGEKRNAFPFDVPAGQSRAIWVEVHVPANAAPGAYDGAVTISSAEGEAKVPVHLTVWNFDLPSTSSLKSAFSLGYHTPMAGHGLTAGTVQVAELRARYGQLGLDHRISLTHLSDDGLGGWDHFDRTYGPLLDGTASTTLAGAKLTSFKYIGNENNPAQYKDWAQHFKANGWFDRLFAYICDEPGGQYCAWSQIKPLSAAANAGDPAIRTLVTTSYTDAEKQKVDGSIDVYVPVVNYVRNRPDSPNHPGDHVAGYHERVAKQGKEFWTYQSCMSHDCGGTVDFAAPTSNDHYYTGWPSYMIDVSAVRNRAMQWIDFQYGVTGELYFETTEAYVGGDPWSNQWRYTGNGDGTLLYPGTPAKIGGSTHIPVASIRLKMIREGMEDFEYLKLLKDLGDEAGAQEIATKLFPSPWQTEASAADLMAAREALARRILALKGEPVVTEEPASLLADQVDVASPVSFGGAVQTAVTGGGGGGCSSSSGMTSGLGALLLALVGYAVVRGGRRRARVYSVVRVMLPAKK